MSTNDRDLLQALLRNDFGAFIQRSFQTVVPGQPFLPNWHVDAIAYELERCLRGEIRRLIITVPPRHLKSHVASVALPAWALGHDPTLRIICVSYSQDLTSKHARDCRTVVESPWYRNTFPGTRIDPRKNTEAEFETTARGYRLGTSVGGTLTGRGGNIIIIDDPMKPAEAMSEPKRRAVCEFYDSTLLSRLDDKGRDIIIVVMQRLHADDLVGHLVRKGEHWVHLNLPAIADAPQEIAIGNNRIYRRSVGEVLHPEREPKHVLGELRDAMGTQAFSAQYQQAPVPPGGALIKGAWFRSYDRLPERQPGNQIIQSWDIASNVGLTNDYSVCTTWLIRGTDYYLIDVDRQKLEFPDLRRRILTQAEAYGATAVLIEDTGAGTALIQDLRSTGPVRPIPIHPEGDKVVRLVGQSAVLEAGHVLLPETAPWLDEFMLEILAFPGVRHDDQVDSVSQFLIWAAKQRQHVQLIGAFPIIVPLAGWDSRY